MALVILGEGAGCVHFREELLMLLVFSIFLGIRLNKTWLVYLKTSFLLHLLATLLTVFVCYVACMCANYVKIRS